MTLYLWMHWFWITSLCFCDVMGDLTTEHPIPIKTTNLLEEKIISSTSDTTKENSSIYVNPPSTPPNLVVQLKKTTKVKLLKPSFKKYDGFMTTSGTPNVSKDYETTVINQNITDKVPISMSENQINASLALMNFNNTDTNNTTYFDNETSFNESQLLNSERIAIESESEENGNLSAAGITGISLGCVIAVGLFCSISYFLYRNRGFNRPQVLNDRCSNPDSSGYLDDASVRDNSEEMYSLDNDSFLNSLEAMTIQNYWTDTVKHTKL